MDRRPATGGSRPLRPVVHDLDITQGRLEVVLANGYAPDEFAMRRTDERAGPAGDRAVHTLRAAFTGEQFEFRGRTVWVTPQPCQTPGPPIMLWAASEPAA